MKDEKSRKKYEDNILFQLKYLGMRSCHHTGEKMWGIMEANYKTLQNNSDQETGILDVNYRQKEEDRILDGCQR